MSITASCRATATPTSRTFLPTFVTARVYCPASMNGRSACAKNKSGWQTSSMLSIELACWQRLHLAQASGPATKSAERRAYRQQPRKRSASELRINATEAYIATETYMKSDDSAEITSWWRETLERVALVLATLIV